MSKKSYRCPSCGTIAIFESIEGDIAICNECSEHFYMERAPDYQVVKGAPTFKLPPMPWKMSSTDCPIVYDADGNELFTCEHGNNKNDMQGKLARCLKEFPNLIFQVERYANRLSRAGEKAAEAGLRVLLREAKGEKE